jgi:outer membrane immunogenic protein
MKRLLIAAGILALNAGMGSAADMRMPAKAKPIVDPPYSWGGFYLGGNVGYGWGRATTDQTNTTISTATTQLFRDFPAAGLPLANGALLGLPALGAFPQVATTTASAATSGRARVDGVIGGGQAGYNWQFDRSWLVGIEADLQASGQRGDVTGCSVATCAAGSAFGSASHELKWFGTVRGRLGVLPWDRVLLYATGGLAYGEIESTYVTGINGLPLVGLSSSTTRVGWTAGAGVEGALDRNWTVKLEYLYMDLGRFGGGSGTGATATTVVDVPVGNNVATLRTTTVSSTLGTASTKFSDHILRAGINYRF